MSHHIDVPEAASPGLRVGLSTETANDVPRSESLSVHVEVHDAARPLHVSVYLDGDLVDSSTQASSHHEVRLPVIRGRHVVTARAIDAAGRWGGASALIEGTAA